MRSFYAAFDKYQYFSWWEHDLQDLEHLGNRYFAIITSSCAQIATCTATPKKEVAVHKLVTVESIYSFVQTTNAEVRFHVK